MSGNLHDNTKQEETIYIKLNQVYGRDFAVTDPIASFLLQEVYQFTEINATSHKK